MKKVLVLGIGNLLLCDEGVGVHAAQSLMLSQVPEGVVVLDIGTAILDAIEELEDADFVIVIDAVKAGGTPGTVYRVPFSDMVRSESIASMHGFDLSRVLALAGRKTMPEVLVIGVEPGVIDWSMDLSPAVSRVFPAVIEQVRVEIDLFLAAYNPLPGQETSRCR